MIDKIMDNAMNVYCSGDYYLMWDYLREQVNNGNITQDEAEKIEEAVMDNEDLMKKCVFINGNRNGYGPDQCEDTMTVRELCDYLLENFDEDCKVFLRNDNGYTYGSIGEYDIHSGRYNEEKTKCDGNYGLWDD